MKIALPKTFSEKEIVEFAIQMKLIEPNPVQKTIE